MPAINSFLGEKLLDLSVVDEIKKQADILLKNKDVAGARFASQHLKEQFTALPQEKVASMLGVYRSITADLKVLALPVLEKEEVKSLLSNNLSFIDATYADILPASLSAWLSIQSDSEKVKNELLAVLPADNLLGEKIKAYITSSVVSAQVGTGRDLSLQLGNDNAGGVKDELFDADEASELASHAVKTSEFGASPLSTDNAAVLSEKILGIVGNVQDKESFQRRAKALIISRLRDVRAALELREYFSRPFAVGGLGISGNALEQSLKLVEQEYQKLHGQSQSLSQNPPTLTQPSPLKGEGTEDSLPIIPSSTITPPTPPSPSEPVVLPTPPPIPAPIPQTRVIRQAPARFTNDKASMDDIKHPDRPAAEVASALSARDNGTMGQGAGSILSKAGSTSGAPTLGSGQAGRAIGVPEELKLLTLADWRKLGGGKAAINHILEKAAILSKESLSERLDAVSSFRASDLFREYLDIGRGALSSGRKLSEALADKSVNPNKMTEDEFFSIAELNGKL